MLTFQEAEWSMQYPYAFADHVSGMYAYADLDLEEGTPADEADVESKSSASESAIWRLTAGKGDGGAVSSAPLRKSGSVSSGDYSAAIKPGEPTSERRTAAGRMDFVLQVRTNLPLLT